MKTSSSLQGDLIGGITSAVISLPVAIACGLLAFAPLGPEYTSMGAKAGLYGAIFASIIGVLIGCAPTQITVPKLSLTMIFAALVSSLCQLPPGAGPASEQIPMILTLAFTSIFMAGLLQLLFGVFRIGHLIKYIPFSVISGYINAIAVLILISQLKFFFGSGDISVNTLLTGNLVIQPPTLIVAVFTVMIMVSFDKFFPALSGSLPALLLGSALHLILTNYVEPSSLGQTIGHIPIGLPQLEFIKAEKLTQFSILINNFPRLIGPAMSMALLASMSTLLCVVIADSISHSHHDGNKALIGIGISNMLLGGFGGLISAGSASRPAINIGVWCRC